MISVLPQLPVKKKLLDYDEEGAPEEEADFESENDSEEEEAFWQQQTSFVKKDCLTLSPTLYIEISLQRAQKTNPAHNINDNTSPRNLPTLQVPAQPALSPRYSPRIPNITTIHSPSTTIPTTSTILTSAASIGSTSTASTTSTTTTATSISFSSLSDINSESSKGSPAEIRSFNPKSSPLQHSATEGSLPASLLKKENRVFTVDDSPRLIHASASVDREFISRKSKRISTPYPLNHTSEISPMTPRSCHFFSWAGGLFRKSRIKSGIADFRHLPESLQTPPTHVQTVHQSLNMEDSPSYQLEIDTNSHNKLQLSVDCEDTRNRNKIINELIHTEIDYIADLMYILQEFRDPLAEGKILKPREIDSIFKNLPELLVVNKELLKNLQVGSSLKQPSIGPAFAKMSSYLIVYSDYCNNHQNAMDTVEICLKNNNSFIHFVNQKRKDPRSRKLDLNSFLIKPLQRICKYPLFLRELLRQTKKEDNDFKKVAEALQKIEDTVKLLNESKRQEENLSKLREIQSRFLNGQRLGLADPSRKFLCQVKYNPFDEELNEMDRSQQQQLFLFTDIIIRAEKIDDEDTTFTHGCFPSTKQTIKEISNNNSFKVLEVLSVESVAFSPYQNASGSGYLENALEMTVHQFMKSTPSLALALSRKEAKDQPPVRIIVFETKRELESWMTSFGSIQVTPESPLDGTTTD